MYEHVIATAVSGHWLVGWFLFGLPSLSITFYLLWYTHCGKRKQSDRQTLSPPQVVFTMKRQAAELDLALHLGYSIVCMCDFRPAVLSLMTVGDYS